jgi:hypothetical protein
MATKKVCDFCSVVPPLLAEWSYFSSNVEDEITNSKFAANWGACGECSRLIEEEDMRSLVERAVNTYFEHNTDEQRTAAQVKAHAYQIYVLFYRHRKGPRTAWKGGT